MSNFKCPKCDIDILEGKDGYYITGCKHYPLEMRHKVHSEPSHINYIIEEYIKHSRRVGSYRFKPV